MSKSAKPPVEALGDGASAKAARLDVRVIPRAPRTLVDGTRGGAILVRLAAPPVDGAANEALIAFLAAELGVGKRHVRIVSGFGSRNKVIEVDALARPALDRILAST